MSAPAQPVAVLLAAGAARRMGGRDKLLEEVDGAPLLRTLALRALAAGLPVAVTLPPGAARRVQALEGTGCLRIEVPDAAEGIAASIRTAAGSDTLPGALMLVPADMPELTTADFAALLAEHRAHPGAILRATDAAGQAGHPVLFPAALRAELARLRGDVGARGVIAAHPGLVRSVPLPGRHATLDLDTPDDWAAWRGTDSDG